MLVNALGYDPTSPESIRDFARKLIGKTLSQVVDVTLVSENTRNRGDLGSMVERLFFHLEPNSGTGPDFPEAGVELKTTGVKGSPKRGYRAKERLVLTMIDFETLVDEEWDTSSLMKKCRLMLLLFALYGRDVPVFDRRFVIDALLFRFPEDDLVQIERDWKAIKEKVSRGLAHELSEGDTFYLAACRKGPGGKGERLRTQPRSEIKAKSRAFSLKPSYVNRIIEFGSDEHGALEVTKARGIEEATRQRIEPFLGKTVAEICEQLGVARKSNTDKGFYSTLVMKILGASGKSVPELVKAGIAVKTVRVGQSGMPKEAMSFTNFKYLELVEQEWEESRFHDELEQRFLFIVFREEERGALSLEKVAFWNMPYQDREDARKVWEETKRRVEVNARDLPKSTESRVAHVRPKARNSSDTFPTPQGENLVKKCFWLNRDYVGAVLRDL